MWVKAGNNPLCYSNTTLTQKEHLLRSDGGFLSQYKIGVFIEIELLDFVNIFFCNGGCSAFRPAYLSARTSATVLMIPLSRRQGRSTAIVFCPAVPLLDSHIFIHT